MFSTYRCKTCGVVTDEKERLCRPEKLASRAEFCGSPPGDGNPICDRVDGKIEFQCFTCGRLTDKQDLVCSPAVVDKGGEKVTGRCRKTPFAPRSLCQIDHGQHDG